MKKVGLYLILTFIIYLIGQIYWGVLIACEDPLFGVNHIDDIILNIIYTLSGACGLMSGVTLYKLNT
mgnify:FL=1|tara:strand:+ start:1093 stop:1293 length:201 start_codon:yes stop_codon:yes gene_type:complete